MRKSIKIIADKQNSYTIPELDNSWEFLQTIGRKSEVYQAGTSFKKRKRIFSLCKDVEKATFRIDSTTEGFRPERFSTKVKVKTLRNICDYNYYSCIRLKVREWV